MHLLAELTDDEVITTSTGYQQRLWELGDVVEFFVQRVGENDYYEYQIAPNGFTLALHYPDLSCVAAVRNGTRRLEEFFANPPTQARAWKTGRGWNASLTLPCAAAPGDRLRVSSSRYDAGTGRLPILSSTSPHSVRDFHRPLDWLEISFAEN